MLARQCKAAQFKLNPSLHTLTTYTLALHHAASVLLHIFLLCLLLLLLLIAVLLALCSQSCHDPVVLELVCTQALLQGCQSLLQVRGLLGSSSQRPACIPSITLTLCQSQKEEVYKLWHQAPATCVQYSMSAPTSVVHSLACSRYCGRP